MVDSNCTIVIVSGNGIAGGDYDVYGANRTIPRAMTAFTAIAWYNALEILVLIFFMFKKYAGLYFWSLLITAASVIPYSTGAWMKQNSVSHNPRVTDTLLTIGWVLMVPGQSLVLYSRLHLISSNFRFLRFLLGLIITSAVLLCVPTIVLNWRQYTKHPDPYTRGYEVMEKIQISLFTAQEAFISCVYFWEIRLVLKVCFEGKTRKLMWQLVGMNAILLVLDIALLTIQFYNLYMIQTTFKSLVYSFKLKIEFGVLSQIVRVIQDKSEPNSLTLAIPKTGVVEEVQQLDCEAQVTQRNLPVEWRMSVGHGGVCGPDLIERMRRREEESMQNSPTDSFGDIDITYPGRLG